MRTFQYTEVRKNKNGSRINTIKRDITIHPSKNLISDWNCNSKGWNLIEAKDIGIDTLNPILRGHAGSIMLAPNQGKDFITISKTITGLKPNTKYFVSVFVRNNGVKSSQLYLNDELTDYSAHHYVRRLGGVSDSGEDGEIEVRINAYDVQYSKSGRFIETLWLDGFFATELHESLEDELLDTIKEAYPYVDTEKTEPTQYDLLKGRKYTPFKYAAVVNGRRLVKYDKPLSEYGLVDGGKYEVVDIDPATSIMNALLHDIPLMAMLEQDESKVSHAYPKEDDVTGAMPSTYFPRVQYFTGFSLNKGFVDGKPHSSEVNYAINVYIPTVKVRESVSALMITEQIKGILAELGWASIRGSDYYLKKEQLYVLQTQFIQDHEIRKY